MNTSEIITFLSNNFETVSSTIKGIAGSALTVIFLRKNTETKEFEKIKAGRFEEVCEELVNSGKMSYVELYKAKNFLSIAKKADEIYKNVEEDRNRTGSEIKFDWILRFYEAASSVSDEDMQLLWAKLLAGEVESDSLSYSLKTMHVLNFMSSDIAREFEKFCSNLVSFPEGDPFLPQELEYFEKLGITVETIKTMIDYELLSPVNEIVVTPNLTMELFAENDQNKKIGLVDLPLKFKCYLLTETGKEISTLFEWEQSEESLHEFTRLFNDQFQVSLEEKSQEIDDLLEGREN